MPLCHRVGANCTPALSQGGREVGICCHMLCVRNSGVEQDSTIAVAASLLSENSPTCDSSSGKPQRHSCGKCCCLLFMQRERENAKQKLVIGWVGVFSPNLLSNACICVYAPLRALLLVAHVLLIASTCNIGAAEHTR